MNNDVLTFTREEIRELLGVTEPALKTIVKRKQLNKRLYDVGYNLVKVYKLGRDNIYELTKVKEFNKTLEEYQKEWHIIKKKENEVYVSERVNNLDKSVKHIIKSKDELKDIKYDTGKRWDKKLINSNIISINGYVYFAVYPDGRMEEISKEEYSLYWNENADITRSISRLNNDRTNYLITEEYYNQRMYKLQHTMEDTYGYIARRYRSYKEAEDFMNFVNMLNNRNKNNKSEI